ncbi:MAG TPA: hypothetical protein VNL35_15520 [Chloroflexota bacterium]|nr:hypothetical protein [Chloroflexota bacterium]
MIRWFWRHKKISGALIVVIVLIIVGAANQPPQKAATSAVAASTAIPTAQNTRVPAPVATQVPTTVPDTAVPVPSATPADTSTPQPTATNEPTAPPSATVDVRIQQRADFRVLYAHLYGAENLCDAAAASAQAALTAAQKDSSQLLAAYEAANTAHGNCDTASTAIAMMNAPDSLSSLKASDLLNYSFARVGAIRDEWYDVAQALNAGTADLSTQATLNGHIKDAANYAAAEETNLAVAVYTLNIKLDSITPIAPS